MIMIISFYSFDEPVEVLRGGALFTGLNIPYSARETLQWQGIVPT